MSERRQVVYDRWDGGHRGHMSRYQAGVVAPFRYEAQNLLHDSRQGALVPRRGAQRVHTAPAGVSIIGLGWVGTTGGDLWYASRNNTTEQLRFTIVDSAAAPGAGTVSADLGVIAAGEFVSAVEGPQSLSYAVAPGVGLFRLDHVAKTVTLVSATLGGHSVAFYGDRLYVGGVSGTTRNRVFYSDALAFSTFGALSWFDVGHGPEVRFLASQRGHLTIGLQDGTWWVLNGLVASGGSLRRVAGGAVHPWHFFGQHAVVLGDSRIAYVPISHDTPAFFDGAVARIDEDRSIDGTDLTHTATWDALKVGACRGVEPDEVVFRSGSQGDVMLLNRRGAWARVSLGALSGSKQSFVASDAQGSVYFDGVNGAEHAIYRWKIGPTTLATTSTDALDVGVATPPAAFLYLPEWWHPEAANVMVRSVVVDHLVVNDGVGDGSARLTCRVDALQSGVSGTVSANISSASVDKTVPAVGGVARGQTKFNFGEQGHGRGFQVSFDNIEGVAVQRVTVLYMVDAPVDGR